MAERKVTGLNEDPVTPEATRATTSREGVDLTLIRWMLTLTPTQRLKVLQQNVRSILRLRHERTTQD
jgi:hypothetical protein